MSDDIITKVSARAAEAVTFGGCSQAVLGALQEVLGIGNGESYRAATVLAAGVAKRGETCGAVIGALMALGIARGRSNVRDKKAYNRAMDDAQDVIDAFKAGINEHYQAGEPLESTMCPAVQAKAFGRSFNFLNPSDREAFFSCGGYGPEGCPTVCGIAAAVAARKILES